MKKEHYLQALLENDIPIIIHEGTDRAGVIKHTEFISTTYYEDDEVITALQVFLDPVASKKPTEQLAHSTLVLKILITNIDLITGLDGPNTLRQLGMFEQPFKGLKQLRLNDYNIKVEAVQGLLMLTIGEVVDEKNSQTPPIEI